MKQNTYNNNEEQTTAICKHMDEFCRYNEWKKPGTEECNTV